MKSGLQLAIALKGIRGFLPCSFYFNLISRRKVSRIVQLEGCYGIIHYNTIFLIRYIYGTKVPPDYRKRRITVKSKDHLQL
jgi:hypothetical protein